MRAKLIKLLKIVMLVLVSSVVAVLVFRAWQSQRGEPLAVWHTYAPAELTAKELAKIGWDDYLPPSKKSLKACASMSRKSWTRNIRFHPIAIIPAARSIRASSPPTGTALTSWSRKESRSAPWCFCMD